MSSARKNWLVILGVAFPAIVLCGIFLNTRGMTVDNLQILLRVTARISFLIFLVAFIARPLRTLFTTDTTRWLLRERRSFGLAFASMHTVHAGVIMLYTNLSPEIELVQSGNIFGALIYVLILLMVITSFDGPARAIGSINWRRLHKTGLYVIGIAFLQTIVPRESGEFGEGERMVIVALTAAAILIRIAAYLTTRKKA